MLLATPAMGRNRWPNEPAAFAGVNWGANIAEARRLHPDAQQGIWGNGSTLYYDLEVGTVSTHVVLCFRDDRLVQVMMRFSASAFIRLKKVFIEKYGPPTRITSEGGEPVFRWQGKVIKMRLFQHAQEQENEGGAVFQVLSYTEGLTRQQGERLFRNKVAADGGNVGYVIHIQGNGSVMFPLEYSGEEYLCPSPAAR
jgi:hypothetical protein